MSEPIEFFFDVVSPYSYLASSQIAALSIKTGRDIRWRPFFLGGVMKATGNEPPANVPARARYLFSDLVRWAKRYDIPFNFPTKFPMNTLMAQRMCTAIPESEVQRLAHAFFSAYWQQNADLSDARVLQQLASEAGFDGVELLAEAIRPENKEKLKKVTDEAVSRGAFGAPTFFVDNTMFFGNDRLDFVAKKAMS